MKFGCCASLGNEEVVAKAGYAYVEPSVTDVIDRGNKEVFLKIKEEVRNWSIKPEVFNCFFPGDLKLIGKENDLEKAKEYAKEVLGRIAELEGKIVVFGSGSFRKVPDNYSYFEAFSQLIKFCQFLAEEARKNRIMIAIEPLNRKATNIVTTLTEGSKLIEEVNRQEVKLLVDLFHFTEEEEPFNSIIHVREELVHVHIPVPDIEGINPYPKRFFHKKFFQYLKEINYRGRITVEDNGGRFNNFSKQVLQVLEYITKLWEEA